ncbi:MAG: hypothetical protein RIQ99_940 [Pseudomonadota bacterium]|jgi:diguanylate cyclase (GGDEF)-like protein
MNRKVAIDHNKTRGPGLNGAGLNGTRLGQARRDMVALGIVCAALLLFVRTGGTVLGDIVRSMTGQGNGPDRALSVALLLNIALVIFGWRRYHELACEIQERRKAEGKARDLAERDPLTGCLNRRSIGPQTDTLIGTATLRGKAVAFIMLDIDCFKQVNDLHGHLAGDTLLRQIAIRIRAQLPPDALLGRLGGDEFACIVPFEPDRKRAVDELVMRVIEAAAMPVDHGGLTLETTISVGVTRNDEHDRPLDAQALLHMADIAMYHSKNKGKNRYFWFEPSMESELLYRSELERGIRRGIGAGEFIPYYEKQVDLATGKIVGLEMLARWHSPTLGVVSPDVFIPVAEEIGLIADLSECVIRQALNDARNWDPGLTLSVNISPLQMRDPWFAQRILKLLVEANFPPNRLDIEVTENCLHDNIALVRSMITSLKNQGIRITLDDFGTGYSSLSQLHSLPFDRIKIDRSFVTQLPGNPDCATIVRSIKTMSEGLGLPITAEGVESVEVLEELQQFGTFNAQGYYFGHPVSAQDMNRELAALDLVVEQEPRPNDGSPPATRASCP